MQLFHPLNETRLPKFRLFIFYKTDNLVNGLRGVKF